MESAGVVVGKRKSLARGLESVKNLKLSELGWLVLINGLIFESYLDKFVLAADYFDEVAVILLLACAVASSLGKDAARHFALSGWEKAGLFALVAVVSVGLLSGFVASIQPNIKPVLIDLLACIKFPIALLSGYYVFGGSGRLYALFLGEAKLLLVIMLPFVAVNQFIDLGMRFDFRYGLYSYQFIFGHPASFAAIIIGFLVLFLANKKQNSIWLVLCWFYLGSSLRSTAIAFAVFSFLIWLTSRKSGRIGIGQISAFALVALYLGWSQIQYYFVEADGSARRMLLNVGFKIADRFFPLGSGFATYGSSITGQPEYYSALYPQYGLSSVYGLTLENPSFLSDSFWPIVFGQFGWLGAIVYILMLIFIFFGTVNRLKLQKESSLPFVLGFSYICLTTMSSSAFFNPVSIYLAICISLAVCQQIDSAKGEVDDNGL